MLNRLLSALYILSLTLVLACGGDAKKEDTTPTGGGGDTSGGGDTGGGDTAGGGDTGGTMAAGDAAAGATVNEDSCSNCHGDAGEGSGKTPAIKGDGALGRFGSDKELWDYVKKEMPKDDPGSLSDEDVANVIAWMKS